MTSTNNILLIEDNADDRDLTIRVLTRGKIANQIDVARDGEEALEYFEDHSRPLPALVLLDLKLPKIMGLDVLNGLRANERTKLLPSDQRAATAPAAAHPLIVGPIGEMRRSSPR